MKKIGPYASESSTDSGLQMDVYSYNDLLLLISRRLVTPRYATQRESCVVGWVVIAM